MALGRISGEMLEQNLNLSSNLSFNDNLLVLDNTNSRIGIKNLSPGVELDVAGTARATTVSVLGDLSMEWSISMNQENSLDFSYNTDSKFTLKTDGALTLGTALAVAQGGTGATTASEARAALGLEIGVDVQPAGDVFDTNVTYTFTANQVISVNDNTNAALHITQTGTGNALVVEDDSGNPDSTPFVVDANGKVGIGTMTPIAPLQLSYTAGSPDASLITSDAAIITAQDTAPGFAFVVASNSSSQRGVFKATRARGTLEVPTVPISNDDTFSLLGAIYDGVITRATAAINMAVDGAVSDGVAPQRITFLTGETTARLERMRIDSSGNVGIGTSSPLSKFDLRGYATFGPTSTTEAYQGLTFVNGKDSSVSTTISFIDFRNNLRIADAHIFAEHLTAGGSALLFSTTPDGDRSTDRRQERMRIDSSGNVGIGTTSPQSKLHVASDIISNLNIISGKGSGGVAMTINDGYGNANLTFNHKGGIPEQNGNAARIVVNTDSTTNANFSFQLGSGVSNGVAVGLTQILNITSSGVNVTGTINATGALTLGTALAIAEGGTGQTTAAAARIALLPTLGTAGQVLAVNTGASDVEWVNSISTGKAIAMSIVFG